MLHALLLSPDDQAVSAITGVLEEMSVTCERPLDGVSAAQKLNSQIFDLVLVDCENLPAAKLIFDVCRRGKNGNNPVPIAIVDGRAGLPTAFRLGAELILTKPVAKDQARSTIRGAVGRARKDIPNESIVVQTASAGIVIKDSGAQAATAAPQLASHAEPNPGFARGTVPPSYLTAALCASGLTTKMHSAMEAVERENETKPTTPRTNPQSVPSSESSSRVESPNGKATRPLDPADDLVLASLDRPELPPTAELTVENSLREKAEEKERPARSVLYAASDKHGQTMRRAPLLAFLMLLCAGGGFYAVWTYQPGFREVAQPKLRGWLGLSEMSLTAAASSAKPSTQLSLAKTPTPISPAPAKLSQTQPVVMNSTNSATAAATSPSPAASPFQPKASTAAVIPTPPGTASAGAPVVNKPEASNSSGSKTTESKKEITAASSSESPLLDEKNTVILSSKGAEKRLLRSVPPVFPVDRRAEDAKGTIVLRTVVSENGDVEGVRLVDGNPTLATAAIQAVKQWHYRPYLRDGKAMPFQTLVIIDLRRP
jgi:periplasmic protein TonB